MVEQEQSVEQTERAPENGAEGWALPRKRRAPYSLRIVFFSLLLFPLVFGAVLLLSLIDREVAAPSWIANQISREAGEMLGGGSLRFDGMTLTLGRDLHPKIAMKQVVIRDSAGAVIVRVPKIEVGVSPRGLVLARSILVQQVNLTGMQILVRREGDGGVAVAFELGTGSVGEAESFAGLLDQLDASFARSTLAALEFVRADGLIINYEDALSQRNWTLDGGQVLLENSGQGVSLDVRAALLSGRDYVSEIAFQFDSDRQSGERAIAVDLRDVVAADLSTQLAALSWLSVLDAPLSGALRTSVLPGGQLGALSATLDLGAGVIDAGGGGRIVPFDGAKAYVTFDPQKNTLVFDTLTAQSPYGNIVASGRAQLENVSGALPEEILGYLEVSELVLPSDFLWQTPPEIEGATASFRLKVKPFSLEVGRVSLTSGDTVLSGGIDVEAKAEGWSVSVDATTDSVSHYQAMSLWPEGFLPITRRWLANNILQGEAQDFSLSLRKEPKERVNVGLSFDFDAAALQPLGHLPVIEGASGRVALLNGALSVGVDTAAMRSPTAGRVELGGVGFFIEDIFESPAVANLDFNVDGTSTAVLSIIDEPPWGYVARAGLEPDVLDGMVEGNVRVRFPLKAPPYSSDDIDVAVSARARDVRTSKIVEGRLLTASQLDVSVKDRTLQISGPGLLNGIPLTLSVASDLGPTARPDIHAEFDLTPQTLDVFNIRLDGINVSGRANGHLEIEQASDGRRAVVTSDLMGLSLDAPALQWRKSPDEAGDLRVDIALDRGRLDVPLIAFASNGIRLEGLARANDEGQTEVRFDTATMRDVGDTTLRITAVDQGAPPRFRVEGGWFNLQHFINGQTEVAGPTPPIDLAVDEMWVTDDIFLSDFRGALAGGTGISGRFTGRLNGSAPLQGTISPAEGGSAIRIQANDAGGVITAMGLLERASGGDLLVRLLPGRNGAQFEGQIEIDDLRVVGASALAELLDAISVVGLLQQLDGQGILFTSVNGDFTIWPDRIVIHQPSNATGPGLGLSMDGVYLIETGEMDFQGVISPLYLFNGLGAVVSRPGEGLIGFNYRLTGEKGARSVGINPLSVLTPGIFRDLFRSPSAATSTE